MITAGIDVGSLTSKAVIMDDGKILGSIIIKSKARPWESADLVLKNILSASGLSKDDIKFITGTGYGRDKISYVNEIISEIACHGRGAQWLVPSARTVIDIGGQDCKVMRLAADGKMEKFSANDKCASGTGRFLEVMAGVLCIGVDELGGLSARSRSPITFASACTVWAQADVIQYLNDKVPAEDIAAGINNAMAVRVSVLANNIGIERDVCMTGGVAKNTGVVSALESLIGIRLRKIKKADPQLAGAIGAALFGLDRIKGGAV